MKLDRYIEETNKILTKIKNTQRDKVDAASDIIANVIKNNGIIYVFGCGHSHLIGLDSFYRAGGLANVSAILDTDLMLHNGAAKSSAFEKMTGLAPAILKRYAVTENDVLIISSTSGRNGVPVEMAVEARKRNIKTIGIVSSAYFNEKSRYKDGELLYNNVDIYIDNCVAYGDTALRLDDKTEAMGSISTMAGIFILQSSIISGTDKAIKMGAVPDIYRSGNVGNGGEHNAKLVDKYIACIKHL